MTYIKNTEYATQNNFLALKKIAKLHDTKSTLKNQLCHEGIQDGCSIDGRYTFNSSKTKTGITTKI